MKVKAGKERELVPNGDYNATCVGIIDLGTQPSEMYNDTHQLRFEFELEGKKFSDGEPFIIGKNYSMTVDPKSNLFKVITDWTGESPEGEYEIDQLLGKTCRITVQQKKSGKGSMYMNVTRVREAKGKVKPATSEVRGVYLDETFDPELFDTLPDWMKDIITPTAEYERAAEAAEKPKKKGGKKK